MSVLGLGTKNLCLAQYLRERSLLFELRGYLTFSSAKVPLVFLMFCGNWDPLEQSNLDSKYSRQAERARVLLRPESWRLVERGLLK